MQDRRRHLRREGALSVDYDVIGPDYLKSSAECKNISAGGICVPLRHKLTLGTPLKLKLNLIDYKECLDLEGRIVWLRDMDDRDFPYLAGIEFLNIEVLNQKKILDYVKNRLV